MDTRGFIGIVRREQTLATYNRYFSRPDTLGAKVLMFTGANITWIDLIADQFFALERVDPEARPTAEQVARLKARGYDAVNGYQGTWNQVLESAQGDLGSYLKAGVVPVLFDTHVTEAELPNDLDWGYLINVDDWQIEVYRPSEKSGVHGYWTMSFDDLDQKMNLRDLEKPIKSLRGLSLVTTD